MKVRPVQMLCTSGGEYATQLSGSNSLDFSGAAEGGGEGVELNGKGGGSMWDEE